MEIKEEEEAKLRKDNNKVKKVKKDDFAKGFSEPWAAAFKLNKSLLHVDMSYNNIEADDVEIIAEGLKSNHSILGIHFTGNKGFVDMKGFLLPG